MSDLPLPAVARTAVMVAGLRAVESRRPDRLVDDPFASLFVEAAGPGVAPDPASMPLGTGEFLATRTRFFDDQARAAAGAGVRQVILVAAGLDCRAFRMDWPLGLHLFELDLPELFAFKEPVLAAAHARAGCERAVVAVDLRGEWAPALTAAGFDPTIATLWLAEGLMPYLPPAERERLLATITALSTSDSWLMFDYIEAAATERPVMRETIQTIRSMGAEILGAADSPAESLAAQGWRVDIHRVPDEAENLGRPLPAGMDMVASNSTLLTVARR